MAISEKESQEARTKRLSGDALVSETVEEKPEEVTRKRTAGVGNTADDDISETEDVDFSFVNVVVGGRTQEVAFPSVAAKALGVVACENGHPNVPNAATKEISCGCGSTTIAEED